ncbi:hypothetical protein Q7P35_012011 [Cladosporium inversicolor]
MKLVQFYTLVASTAVLTQARTNTHRDRQHLSSAETPTATFANLWSRLYSVASGTTQQRPKSPPSSAPSAYEIGVRSVTAFGMVIAPPSQSICIYISTTSAANKSAPCRTTFSTPTRRKKMKPMQICTLFTSTAAIAQGSLITRDLECDICQEVVTTAAKDLPSETTDDQITTALESVCLDVAQRDQVRCDTFIDQNEGELVSVLRAERDPGLACAQPGVCQ